MVDFLELINLYPRASIIILALALSFFISLINYFFLDKERLREIKSRQKDIQTQIKVHQKSGDHNKAMELQKEMFSHTGEMFKHSLKPMLITTIPALVFFFFIRNTFEGTTIASTWLWYYFISAIIGSIIFRKVLNLP